MSKSKIQINNTDICVRPSSVDSYLGCSYQWARVFLTGETSIPNARAAIGTAIHRGVEVMWQEAIDDKKKEPNISKMTDAAIQEFQEQEKLAEGKLRFDDGENQKTAAVEVVRGVEAYVDDIVEFADIPLAVETRMEVEISDHPIVKQVGGTLDYLGKDNIVDTKTSKRKATPGNYEIQQSIYKELAQQNGHKVDYNLIHNVVLGKRDVRGEILQMPTNVPKAKTVMNNLLDTLEVLAEDIVKPEVLFKGNPKYYLCSDKYCAFYKDCMFVKGEQPEQKKTIKL